MVINVTYVNMKSTIKIHVRTQTSYKLMETYPVLVVTVMIVLTMVMLVNHLKVTQPLIQMMRLMDSLFQLTCLQNLTRSYFLVSQCNLMFLLNRMTDLLSFPSAS